jgi:hypothetical protein
VLVRCFLCTQLLQLIKRAWAITIHCRLCCSPQAKCTVSFRTYCTFGWYFHGLAPQKRVANKNFLNTWTTYNQIWCSWWNSKSTQHYYFLLPCKKKCDGWMGHNVYRKPYHTLRTSRSIRKSSVSIFRHARTRWNRQPTTEVHKFSTNLGVASKFQAPEGWNGTSSNQPILGSTTQNLVTTLTWHPGYAYPWVSRSNTNIKENLKEKLL